MVTAAKPYVTWRTNWTRKCHVTSSRCLYLAGLWNAVQSESLEVDNRTGVDSSSLGFASVDLKYLAEAVDYINCRCRYNRKEALCLDTTTSGGGHRKLVVPHARDITWPPWRWLVTRWERPGGMNRAVQDRTRPLTMVMWLQRERQMRLLVTWELPTKDKRIRSLFLVVSLNWCQKSFSLLGIISSDHLTRIRFLHFSFSGMYCAWSPYFLELPYYASLLHSCPSLVCPPSIALCTSISDIVM